MSLTAARVKHAVGYWRPRVEVRDGVRLGVTRSWFGLGPIVGVWGGGVRVKTTEFPYRRLLDLTRADLEGKRVFLTVDWNVLNDKGEIKGYNPAEGKFPARIQTTVETLRFLKDNGAIVFVSTHVGRPKELVDKGKVASREEANRLLSTRTIAPVATDILRREGVLSEAESVQYAEDTIGERVSGLKVENGGVYLLENPRHYDEEEANDPAFAQQMVEATKAEVYVLSAFASAHNDHAHVTGVQSFIPLKVVDSLVETEITKITPFFRQPQRPYLAIFGGAKISDKLRVVESFVARILDTNDELVIGGAMASTVLKAMRFKVGRSLVEEAIKVGKIKTPASAVVADLVRNAEASGIRILVPRYVYAVRATAKEKDGRTVYEPADEEPTRFDINANNLPDDYMIVDNDPTGFMVAQERPIENVNLLERARAAQMVVWNGPLGMFEKPKFSAGTNAVAQAVAETGAQVLIGGGDSEAAIAGSGHKDAFIADAGKFISTGGGAMLKFLEKAGALVGLTRLVPPKAEKKAGAD